MLPQKKTFSECFFFTKINHTKVKSLSENQRENLIFGPNFLRQIAFNFLKWILYNNKRWFWTLLSAQTVCSHFHTFSGWGTSRGPKSILKAFSFKLGLIYLMINIKYNLSVCKMAFQNWISCCILETWFDLERLLFLSMKIILKKKSLIMPKFWW